MDLEQERAMAEMKTRFEMLTPREREVGSMVFAPFTGSWWKAHVNIICLVPQQRLDNSIKIG
jgi:hypothetical protein